MVVVAQLNVLLFEFNSVPKVQSLKLVKFL
jgi:hypothetical protein